MQNDLHYKKKDNSLTSCESSDQLANRFADYFSHKIEIIIDSFTTDTTRDGEYQTEYNVFGGKPFLPISNDDLKKLILKGNSKCCHLDPVPTTVLKQVIDCVLPILSAIVNTSLAKCIFPSQLKSATVVPLIKKASLNKEDLKNYRPVSNLPYISKLI